MLSGPVFSELLMTQFAAQGFTGSQLLQLSNGVGNGVANYLLASAIYQGTGIGVGVGAGVGTGFVQGIVGAVVAANIIEAFAAVSFSGSKMSQFAMAIGNAFSDFIALGIVNSTCAGVAVGTGTGTITGIAGPAMAGSISSMLAASGFSGSQMPLFANAVGNGICNSIALGIVITTIIGAGYPPTPTSGVDIGKLS